MKQIEEFESILDITCKVFKINKEELLTKSRADHLQIPRNVAAVIGIQDACIERKIVANGLNRDRSGTYHYQKNHKEFFEYNGVYRNGYIKVLKNYKKIDVNKKVFLNKSQFNLFIKKINFINSNKPDIIITITVGKYMHSFLSDCFKFTEDMVLIKEAFKDYKTKINFNTYEG